MIQVHEAWREGRKHKWNRLYNPQRVFWKFGFEQIGHGSRSTVYAHPELPDIAIKVGWYDIAQPRGKKHGRDAWLTYVLNAQHWNDKKVPKVYHVAMYRDFYVAVMERCYRDSNRRKQRTAKPIREDRGVFGVRLNALAKAHKVLVDLSYSETGNIMRRKNREIVVTDPLYCPYGYQHRTAARKVPGFRIDTPKEQSHDEGIDIGGDDVCRTSDWPSAS